MLDLSSLDLEEIAAALADQTDYEHRWLINTETGEIVFWTSDTEIDGQTAVDLDESDLLCIDPLPSSIWYQDMAELAAHVSDERAGRRLARAIQGKGAFRRFKAELHEEFPQLLPAPTSGSVWSSGSAAAWAYLVATGSPVAHLCRLGRV